VTCGIFIRVLTVTLCLMCFHVHASSLKNSACLDCHDDNTLFKTNSAGRAISLFVDEAELKLSMHGTNTCISCHADITKKHPDGMNILWIQTDSNAASLAKP
jgi:hypothetical protein